MSEFTIHDTKTAPAGSRAMLEQAEKAFGFVPNLLGILAESPAALDGYNRVAAAFSSSSFSATEQQIVLMTTSFLNGCPYCMAAHSAIAGMQGVPRDVIRSLRDGTPLADPKLEALRDFTGHIVRGRGWIPKSDLRAFLDAGYTRAQALEVILGVTQKTLSNYVNHIAGTPLDAAFESTAWSAPEPTPAD